MHSNYAGRNLSVWNVCNKCLNLGCLQSQEERLEFALHQSLWFHQKNYVAWSILQSYKKKGHESQFEDEGIFLSKANACNYSPFHVIHKIQHFPLHLKIHFSRVVYHRIYSFELHPFDTLHEISIRTYLIYMSGNMHQQERIQHIIYSINK